MYDYDNDELGLTVLDDGIGLPDDALSPHVDPLKWV